MLKLDQKLNCPKCGFRPTFQVTWKLEYKDECKSYSYGSTCDWDSDVSEHLHQECPACGYMLAVACEDNASVTPDKWTTGTTGKPVAPVKPVGRNPVRKEIQPLITACNANRASTRGVVQPAKVTPIVNHATTRQNNYTHAPVTPVVPVKCRTCPVDAEKA